MKNEIDMLNGKLLPSLIKFALPIAASSMLQQLFTAADTTVVGRFAGSNALAAVGTNSEFVALIVTVSAGLAVGSNVLVARYIGQNHREKIPQAIFSSLFLAIIIGIIGLLGGLFFSRQILHSINAPAVIFENAVAYLNIYFLGYPFLVMYDFCSAILRGYGDSRRPFIILMLSGILNVILNLVFVIVFKMGVVGVAIATDIANIFCCCTVGLLLFRQGAIKMQLKKIAVSLNCIKYIITIGFPAAIQGAVFCFANLFVTAAVNSFGAVATAGSTISCNYEYFTYYIVIAFGQAATTFTSQNFAAKNKERCKTILKYCMFLGIIFTAFMTVPISIYTDFFASLFSSDPEVIKIAGIKMKIILGLEPICAIEDILGGALRGRGYSLQPAVAAMIGICGTRIIWILTFFRNIHTLQALFIIYPISWVVANILMYIVYRQISARDAAMLIE